MSNKLPPLYKHNVSKNSQEKYDKKKYLHTANRNWNDWKFQIHLNMLEWVNSRSKIVIRETYSTSSRKYYFDQDDRTAHWIVHSKLKTLYYNKNIWRKNIIEELEGSLIGAPIDAKNTEVPEVDVEANYDCDITTRATAIKIK